MIRIERFYGLENYHFSTEYPDNKYIEKTVAYGCKVDENRQLVRMGRMEVFLRNGNQYSFECWVGTSYCAQFGIQVSHDGRYIYVISDEKGLWCYTYKGDLVWKTRYTSVSYVIPHSDNKITCVLTTKLLILDSEGKIVKQTPIYREFSSDMASESVIVSNTSETVAALFDAYSLEILCKISLKALGLKYICKIQLDGDILSILGFSLTQETVDLKVNLKEDSSVIKKG